jgi:hypothetical protein
MKSLLIQLSKNAIAIYPEGFTEIEKAAQWIGKLPATDMAIAEAEKRLNVTLPADYKEFIKISNGTSILLDQTFGGFMPIEKIDFMVNLEPDTIANYAGISDDMTENLKNSIIVSGQNYIHLVLLIQPHGKFKDWQYWEFAHYTPGETPVENIQAYLTRINDFLVEQLKSEGK